VNKFPDFVRYIVQRLKTLCPTMGKVKIAQTLSRAGLHLGSSTVGRILKEESVLQEPPPVAKGGDSIAAVEQHNRVVTAKHPNHVWHVDLTAVPIVSGFWATWSPFALPQRWPFCWWVAVVVDHFSRRVMGVSVWEKPPSSLQVRHFLGQSIARTGRNPKYIISDKGPQFWNDDFKGWCRRKHISPRFGAVGQHGSIAIVERFILTLKDSHTRLMLISSGKDVFRRELGLFVCWYNKHRPHTALFGKTPHEAYYRLVGANKILRFEPRSRWPARSCCAAPQAVIRGKPGTRLLLHVSNLAGRNRLPIVKLRVAA
jgi:transposase InsO family protein